MTPADLARLALIDVAAEEEPGEPAFCVRCAIHVAADPELDPSPMCNLCAQDSCVILARALFETKASTLRWIPDHDDPDSVDDLFAKGVGIRMERMDNGHYWMAIFLTDGIEHHFDITSAQKIRAFAKQPAPAVVVLKESSPTGMEGS